MDLTTQGKLLGVLLSAFDAARESFVRRRIGEALTLICQDIPKEGELESIFQSLLGGYLDTGAPLRLLQIVSKYLPGQPQIGPGLRIEGKLAFFDGPTVIVGNNASGEILVKVMIQVVREKAATQRRQPSSNKKA